MISLEMQTKITTWRSKARDGSITQEELKEAIVFLREDRKAAQAASKAKPGAKSKAPIDSDALLAQMGL